MGSRLVSGGEGDPVSMSAPNLSMNYGSVYGNNVASSMLNNIPEKSFVELATSGLNTQLGEIQSQVKQVQSQQKAWSALQSDAAAASAGLKSLENPTTWQAMQAKSSNANISAAVDNSAQAGTYTVSVSQLATQEIDGTSSTAIAISSPSTALGLASGSMAWKIGGHTYSVAVSSTTTLNQLAASISTASGSPVKAQVEQSSQGSYYLSIFGSKTGASIGYSGPSGDWADVGVLASTGSVNVVQAAQNAHLTMGSNAYTSATNTFSSVVPGMTIKAATTGSATIQVNSDVQAMTSNVKKFVSDWNQWVKDTQKYAFGTLPNTSLSSTSSFQNNPNQIIQSPQPMSALDGIESTMASYHVHGLGLAGVGLKVGQNDSPTLSLNTASLAQALTNNPSGVEGFFQSMASVMAPMIGDFGSGPTSITGTALANIGTTLSQDKQQETQLKTEMSNAQSNAITQYDAFSQTLGKLANESNMFTYLNGQSTKSSGG